MTRALHRNVHVASRCAHQSRRYCNTWALALYQCPWLIVFPALPMYNWTGTVMTRDLCGLCRSGLSGITGHDDIGRTCTQQPSSTSNGTHQWHIGIWPMGASCPQPAGLSAMSEFCVHAGLILTWRAYMGTHASHTQTPIQLYWNHPASYLMCGGIFCGSLVRDHWILGQWACS